VNSAFLKLALHNLIQIASEMFAILHANFQHIYNYVPNFHTQEACNYVFYKKMFLHGEQM